MALAINDIVEGVRNWRLWYLLGLNEISHRYRRSTLGPFWLTLSMGIQALVMGFLFGYLFQHPIDRFLPFLCISLVIWGFITTTINEGANSLINAGLLIKQVKRPVSIHILQTIWRNVVILAHTIVIFFIVAVIYGIYPELSWFMALAGFILLLANIAWATLFLAILSARFRDVPMIVQNGFTVLFWLTPILYMPEQLGGKVAQIVVLNPLFHVIEVVRAPLLLNSPSTANWVVTILCVIVGWAITLKLLSVCRTRVPYWV